MNETTRVRMVLARMTDDVEPCVVAAVDESIWEHWDDGDEAAWLRSARELWGIEVDTEFKVVVAEFAPQSLVDAFNAPIVRAGPLSPVPGQDNRAPVPGAGGETP